MGYLLDVELSERNQIKALQERWNPRFHPLLFASGVIVPFPASTHDLFKQMVCKLAEGRVITLMAGERALTTQQAADILGVSRPTLVKLLATSAIPYHYAGASKHRRVLLRDLLDYAEERNVRSAKLTEILGDRALEWVEALPEPKGGGVTLDE